MRINSVKSGSIHFGNALSSKRMPEYQKVLQQANTALGTEGGKKVLILHDASLPQSLDTGVGNLSNPKAQSFIALMQQYTGINAVEILPQGEYGRGNKFCPYGGSAFSLSQNVIDPELLTTKEFGKILKRGELRSLKVDPSQDIQYENLVQNSRYDSLLRKAYGRFMQSDKTTVLKKEFENYKVQNADWLEPKSIFRQLFSEYSTQDWQKWSEVDRDLYLKDLSGEKAERIAQRLADLKTAHKDNLDFFAFKQFMADNHLARAKKSLNARGLDLIGDCLIGQSPDEIWANRAAFYTDVFMDWGNRSVNYAKIYNPNGTLGPTGEFLQRKFAAFLRRYDGMRMDVAWGLIQPNLIKSKDGKKLKFYFNGQRNYIGDSIISLLERTAKKVRGEGFDLSGIMYETECSNVDFSAFSTSGAIVPLKNRVQIYTTTYGDTPLSLMHRGLRSDEFIIGVGNHDSISLRSLANGGQAYGVERRLEQYGPLSKTMKIDETLLRENPIELAKTKFGEISGARHQMYFFNDILGNERIFDYHDKNLAAASYRIRIPANFEEAFHGAIQEGWGLNPMDARKRQFIARGLDKTEPELFQKVCEFADELAKKGAKTQAEADGVLKKLPVWSLVVVGAAVLASVAALLFKGKKKSLDADYNPAITFNQEQRQTFADFLC